MQETRIKTNRSDYVLLTLLVGLNVLNFVDRTLIASLANYIVPDLELSNTQFGLLTGLVFVFFYTIMGLFMGFLADRINRIRMIAAAVSLWSLLTALSGAARGFVSLAIPRIFIGVGESALTPAALSMLADRFHSSRLGFVCSAYYLAAPIGTGLSFVIAGELAPRIGWRGSFYLLGAIGLAMVPLLFFFRDSRESTNAAQSISLANDFSLKQAAKDILLVINESRSLKLIFIGSILMALNSSAVVFDQLWLVQERGFERAEIAKITGWFAIFFGSIGALYGAFCMDFFHEKYALPRARFIFYTWLALVPLLIVFRLSEPGTWLFWVGLANMFLLVSATTGPQFAAIQAITPSRVRATMIAFYILCAALFGAGIGNLAIGAAIDWMTAIGASQPYTWVLLLVNLFAATGLIAFYRADSEQREPSPDIS